MEFSFVLRERAPLSRSVHGYARNFLRNIAVTYNRRLVNFYLNLSLVGDQIWRATGVARAAMLIVCRLFAETFEEFLLTTPHLFFKLSIATCGTLLPFVLGQTADHNCVGLFLYSTGSAKFFSRRGTMAELCVDKRK